MQHPQGGLGMYMHPPSAGLAQYVAGDNAYTDYYGQQAAAASPEQQLNCHTVRPGATSLVYMGAQQQHLQQQQQLMQQQQQQQHMDAHMQLQQSMQQQLQQQQQQQMEAHLQHQYAQQQMEVQLQQQLQAQQQEEERQQQECAASAYASAFYGGPPSNPMPPSELAKSCRVLSSMGVASQPQVYETADDALMRSLQQHDSQEFHNNSTLSATPRSVCLNTFDKGLQQQRVEQGGFPQQQMIELQFECVDNMELSHPSALVSLSCFVRPEDENHKESKIKSVTPYLLPADLPRGDEAAHTPQAFVDFKGAKIRLVWRGEEFLHLKINEEVHGQTQSTGFIKLHFSSLQEGIPMRVDVINRQGQPNGFLILRYALLSAADSAAAAAASAYPAAAAAAAAEHHAAAAAELARLPTMPSNLTLQQQQQQMRSFRIGEKPQPLQPNYGDKTRGMKPAGARQTKHSSNSGMFSRFGRWCCELPSVDLN